MTELWTIQELTEAVGAALELAAYDGQSSGRIREIPNTRAIRYYTTLGLVDRPSEMRGRTAYYGWRHLLQLVSIKRLQARGLPLVQIQEQLAGLPDQQLQHLAALPDDFAQRLTPSPPRLTTDQHSRGDLQAGEPENNTLQKNAPQPRDHSVVIPHVSASGRPDVAAQERGLRGLDASGGGERQFWQVETQTDHQQEAAWRREPISSAARPAVVLPLGPGASLLLEGWSPQWLEEAAVELEPLLQELTNQLHQIRQRSQPGLDPLLPDPLLPDPLLPDSPVPDSPVPDSPVLGPRVDEVPRDQPPQRGA